MATSEDESIDPRNEAFEQLEEELAVLYGYSPEAQQLVVKSKLQSREKAFAYQVVETIKAWEAWQDELKKECPKPE